MHENLPICEQGRREGAEGGGGGWGEVPPELSNFLTNMT